MEVSSSTDIMKEVKVSILSIGDSGKGKTYFSGTICDYGKPFVIGAEGGEMTIADKVFDYKSVATWEEFLNVCAWYFKNYKERGYTHLVVDSITRLQQYLALEKDPNGKLTMSQWGEVLASLRKVVDRLTKSCPTHLHMTAMAMEDKDDVTGQIKVFPNVQGRFRFDLAGYFDVVLYHDCGEKEGKQVYWVQTQGDQRITAKSRLSSIGEMKKYDQNNYKIINDIIEKGGE